MTVADSASAGARRVASLDPGGPSGLELVRLARNGAASLGGAATAAVLGFVLAIVVSRGLDQLQAGIFFETVALFMILSNTTELGADTGLVRALPRLVSLGQLGDLRSTIAVALVPVLAAGAAAAAAVYLAAEPLTRVFMAGHEAGAQSLRATAPFLVVAAATTVAVSGTRGFGSVLPLVAITNVGLPLVRPLLVAGVIALSMGEVAASTAWAAPIPVAFAAGLLVLLHQLRATLRQGRVAGAGHAAIAPARPLHTVAAEFWSFTAPRALAAVFEIALIWVDVLIVGAFLSPRWAAVYAAASRFITAGTLGLSAIRISIAPRISVLLATHRVDEASYLHRVACRWVVTLSWPLYLAIAVGAPLLLRVFGPRYTEGAAALRLLCLAMALSLAAGTIQTVLLMGGKSSWNLLNKAAAVVLNVGLNLVLVPRWGIDGAAVAWAATILLDTVLAAAEVRLLLGIRTFDRGTVVVGLGAIACYGGLGLLLHQWGAAGIAGYLGFLVVATVLFAGVLWRFRQLLELWALREAVRMPR